MAAARLAQAFGFLDGKPGHRHGQQRGDAVGLEGGGKAKIGSQDAARQGADANREQKTALINRDNPTAPLRR